MSSTFRDFNGDGLYDFAWAQPDGTVAVWNMSADGTQIDSHAIIASQGTPAASAAFGDFNADGTTDIPWLGSGGLHIGHVVQNFATDTSIISVRVTSQRLAAADFNGDGRDEMVMGYHYPDSSVFNETEGSISPLSKFGGKPPSPGTWYVSGLGDFNGDGKTDLYWQNHDAPPHYARGAITFASPAQSSPFVSSSQGAEEGWDFLRAADFNADGRDDILWKHDNGQASIWVMDRNGTTVAEMYTPPNFSPHWEVVDAGDTNGDGHADIIWRGGDGALSVWLMGASMGAHPTGLGFQHAHPGHDWSLVA